MKNICGIIIGEACSPEEAKRRAGIMKNCPNLVALGTTSNMIYFVFVVPAEKEWWLRFPETNPKETGLEKATVYVIKDVSYPEAFAPMVSEKKTGTAPCGANCETCPLREQYRCDGCPSTIHYERQIEGTKIIEPDNKNNATPSVNGFMGPVPHLV